MICPGCNKPLKITHTYSAGSTEKTQSAHCTSCGKVFTLVTKILREVTRKGEGAFAEAKRRKRV